MKRYCDREGKQIYLDKSLDSPFYLNLVESVFPGVRCILIFRHVMDTIASGLEASPWGFQGYGYLPYVQRNPTNFVASLASYWLDHVSPVLVWERDHPSQCVRIRYEDLVTSPADTIARVQEFLGVEQDMGVLERAFERGPLSGPGDYKVEHTHGVRADSMGHGKRIPVSLLPPPLLTELNDKLVALGYEPLGRSWNAQGREGNKSGGSIWSERLEELLEGVSRPIGRANIASFAIVSEDHQALRWVFDLDTALVYRGDGDVDAVITGTAEDLVLMLSGDANLGVLLRGGRIRYLVAAEDEARRPLGKELRSLIEILEASVRQARERPTTPQLSSVATRCGVRAAPVQDETALFGQR